MKAGLASVVIPVYDRAHGLREAVASVWAQTYPEWEVIIVDDGSTDETPLVAAELAAADPRRIRVLRTTNGGPGRARERGRRSAEGEFIQYLDSDDVMLPEKLALQVAALRARPDCCLAYGPTREVGPDSVVLAAAVRPSSERIERMFPIFLRLRWWNTVAPLYRRAAVDAAGPWSELWLEEDWEYDARVAALGRSVAFVPDLVGEHRHHAGARLSRGEPMDPVRLSQRARAHASIFASARRGGVGSDSPEMAVFARELFLLARHCGASGLAAESERLFHLAREASTPEKAGSAAFLCYRVLAGAFGWRSAGRIAWLADAARGRMGRRRRSRHLVSRAW